MVISHCNVYFNTWLTHCMSFSLYNCHTFICMHTQASFKNNIEMQEGEIWDHHFYIMLNGHRSIT